jgi:hypothetical protein
MIPLVLVTEGADGMEEWAELARAWFPELVDTRLRQVTWPAIAAHRDYVVAQLEAGVAMTTVHLSGGPDKSLLQSSLNPSAGGSCGYRLLCCAVGQRDGVGGNSGNARAGQDDAG